MDQKPAQQLDLERRGQHGTRETMKVLYKSAPDAGPVTINVDDFDPEKHDKVGEKKDDAKGKK